jgi:hypothetical protein
MFYEVIWFLGMSSHSQTKGQVLSVGAFVGGELYPSWMHFFQALYCLYLLIYCFSFFFTSRSDQRTLPWLGGQS